MCPQIVIARIVTQAVGDDTWAYYVFLCSVTLCSHAVLCRKGLYALNTVRSVFESLPPGVLHEIIVVDDGTEPPLSQSYLTPDVLETYQVTIIRHVP